MAPVVVTITESHVQEVTVGFVFSGTEPTKAARPLCMAPLSGRRCLRKSM